MSLHHGELFSLSLYMNSPAKSSHEEGRMNTGFALKNAFIFYTISRIQYGYICNNHERGNESNVGDPGTYHLYFGAG
ncbi:hypothetical protein BVY13_04390 [Bacillus amyloliquefaciens]|nr:hypothetical protein BVY13_04390 [Bacillus amyloliquefaciens]